MNPPDREELPEREPDGSNAAGSTPSSGIVPSVRARSRRLLVALPAAALAAALVAGAIGETPLCRVAPETSKMVLMGRELDTDSITPEAAMEAELQTAIHSLGVFGALLGLSMGLASGIACRSNKAGIIVGVVGLLLGLYFGAASPLAAIPVHAALRTPGSQDLLPSMAMHVLLWAPLASASGFAAGLGRRLAAADLVTSTIAGAIGGAIGAIVFEIVGTIAFPLAGIDKPISNEPLTRFAAYIIVAMTTALLIVTLRSKPTPGSSSSPLQRPERDDPPPMEPSPS